MLAMNEVQSQAQEKKSKEMLLGVLLDTCSLLTAGS